MARANEKKVLLNISYSIKVLSNERTLFSGTTSTLVLGLKHISHGFDAVSATFLWV
jgi:tetrahydromethanopterin S-methyltransferase subunit F